MVGGVMVISQLPVFKVFFFNVFNRRKSAEQTVSQVEVTSPAPPHPAPAFSGETRVTQRSPDLIERPEQAS